jgi:hypothetical protein
VNHSPLFLPDSVLEARRALMRQMSQGEISQREAFERALKLDPADHIALIELGCCCREEGDLAGAEQYYWRAAEAQPWYFLPYMNLCFLVGERAGPGALADGLAELAMRKLQRDEEALRDICGSFKFPSEMVERFPDLEKLEPAERVALVAEALSRRRNLESAEDTAVLRPHRLLLQFHQTPDPDPGLVDALLEARAEIVVPLVGLLRGWARSFLPDDDEGVIENALAVLGEIGGPMVIPYLVQFMAVDHTHLAGAAGWAFDRVFELHAQAARDKLAEISPGLDGPERCAVAGNLALRPGRDPSGHLLGRLSENLDSLPQEELDGLMPALVALAATGNGSAGVERARALIRRYSSRISRQARRSCEEILETLAEFANNPPPPQPSPYTVYDICAGEAVWDEEEEEEDAAPPLDRVPKPGRNDPCWCGSGKKYKKCHLEADERSQKPEQREFDAVRSRVADLFKQVASARETRRAAEEFLGSSEIPADDEALPLMDWMIHDWIPPRLGRNVMAEFLRRHGASLSARERAFVESSARSAVRLYEVQQIRQGTGVEVKDLISDRVMLVHDVRTSKEVVRWDGMLARVVEGERGLEFSGVGLSVPRRQIQPLLEWIKEDREACALDWDEYLKRELPRIRRAVRELGEESLDNLRVTNTDGDPLTFTKAVYTVEDLPQVLAGLRACPDLTEEEGGQRFAWIPRLPDREDHTVLGSIDLDGGKLTLGCNSTPRSDRGKALLAELAGPALRHLRDEITPLAEVKRRAAAASSDDGSQRRSNIPAAEEQRLITQFLDRHYSTWPDTSLPALAGMTPRQAVETPEGRAQVVALLRDFENASERSRKAGEPTYDFSRLRAELGLDG